ncbi:hypothetical protein [Planctomyces sp. SH-PL62]|uniref:hypothetical protein n=1 Tax=Planctomyces sp. SH-PL62 TaxID=1636152 RepID=UPI00078B761E|nr:hypothetical protein [Planctomyces sp. SH-PL62]AMV39072.1 hypothetical protein VT85_16665 [Planctomyces sp. SH-PL62]
MSELDADPSDASLATADEGSVFVFDVPAFARRGLEVESLIHGLDERCRRHRRAILEMVQMRLRQWAKGATGAEDWRGVFRASIEPLWPLVEAPIPRWAEFPASPRRRRAIARDLVASVERFNVRWTDFVARLDLPLINRAIHDYNRFYVIEKECVLGSARLAAAHFRPLDPVSQDTILAAHPPLPVPEPLVP